MPIPCRSRCWPGDTRRAHHHGALGYRWFLADAIAAARQCPNIYMGLSVLASETIMVQQIYRAVGPTRMVFGSDAPSCYPDLAAEAIRRLRLGREADDLIFGGVLQRIYRLER